MTSDDRNTSGSDSSPHSSDSGDVPSDAPVHQSGESTDGDADSTPTLRTERIVDGRYRLESPIDSGGMGTVYRAEHAMLEKEVAVKMLHSELSAQSEMTERFRREAQAAAHLDHPHVCSVTDFGLSEEGGFYMVMELLEGETLAEHLEHRGPLTPDRVVELLDQLADALEEAHEMEIVHRDLKPANVLLVERSESECIAKILDFGIARIRLGDDHDRLTQTGAVLGTPTYMSPEQAAGDPVDSRTDLYALGAVAFEMLTGRPVFKADRSAKVMADHVSTPPPSPGEVVQDRDIPERLGRIVRQLLAKHPDDRPDSAGVLRSMLEGSRDPSPVSDEPNEASTEARRTDDTEADDASADATDDEATTTLQDGLDDLSRGLETLRQVDGRLRLAVAVSGLALLGLALGLAAIFFIYGDGGGSPEAMRDALGEARRTLKERPDVEKALELHESGRTTRAIDTLEQFQRREASSNPNLAYLLGRLELETGDRRPGLEHYRRTLALEPDYAVQTQIWDAALDTLDDAKSLRSLGRRLVTSHLDRRFVRHRVGRAAWRHDSSEVRERARQLLDSGGWLDSLPGWLRHSIEMRRARGCDAHRTHIQALVELGDPEGLEVLRFYQRQPERGCGTLGMSDCFGCIRSDLRKAIQTLSSEQREE